MSKRSKESLASEAVATAIVRAVTSGPIHLGMDGLCHAVAALLAVAPDPDRARALFDRQLATVMQQMRDDAAALARSTMQ